MKIGPFRRRGRHRAPKDPLSRLRRDLVRAEEDLGLVRRDRERLLTENDDLRTALDALRHVNIKLLAAYAAYDTPEPVTCSVTFTTLEALARMTGDDDDTASVPVIIRGDTLALPRTPSWAGAR